MKTDAQLPQDLMGEAQCEPAAEAGHGGGMAAAPQGRVTPAGTDKTTRAGVAAIAAASTRPKGPQVDVTTHRARIVGPVSYRAGSGRRQNIPMGPCLVESIGGRSIDIVWGTRGQSCVALPVEEIEAAQDQGNLVLLD